MTKQPKYKLYAIYTKHLAKDELKGFEYSLVANNRYALIFTADELKEPYRAIRDGIPLEKDEAEWLLKCKTEINARFLKEHPEYADLLSEFCDRLDEELQVEKEKLNGEKK